MSSMVGTIVDEVTFEVERGKIREFALATSTLDPVHTETAAARAVGYPDVLATATHSVVTGHQRDQQGFVAALGLDIARVVVGWVGWTYERPLRAGDRLTAKRTVVDDSSREGRSGVVRLVTLLTTFADADGEVVASQREVLVERPQP